MQLTTFGGAHITQEYTFWWFQHVQAPCTHVASPWGYLQQVEGTKLLPVPEGYNTSMSNKTRAAKKPRSRSYAPSSSGTPWAGKGTWDEKGKAKGKGKAAKGAKGGKSPKGDKGKGKGASSAPRT